MCPALVEKKVEEKKNYCVTDHKTRTFNKTMTADTNHMTFNFFGMFTIINIITIVNNFSAKWENYRIRSTHLKLH